MGSDSGKSRARESPDIAKRLLAVNGRVDAIIAEHATQFAQAGAPRRLQMASDLAVLILDVSIEGKIPSVKNELFYLRFALSAQRSVYGLVTRSLQKLSPQLTDSDLGIARVAALRRIESHRPKSALIHDIALLEGEDKVTYETAVLYGQVSPEYIRTEVRNKTLTKLGKGQSRRITVASLIARFPPT